MSGFLFTTNVKNFTMTKYDATQKVKKRIQESTKEEVSKELGISRPTLDARLQWHTWKVSELVLIEKILP